jgi:hypothetical protein
MPVIQRSRWSSMNTEPPSLLRFFGSLPPEEATAASPEGPDFLD